MRKNISILSMVMLFVLLAFLGCSGENDINNPKFIGSTPDAVSDYTVESIPGGAKITFKMPVSADLLYIKAEYKLASGLKRETKSSLYKNYLIVDGFDKVGTYDVVLYAVAKGEVYSEPTPITIDALTPPFLMARNSLELLETFGGVNVTCENEIAANLSLTLLEKDSTNSWTEKYTHYFNSKNVDFSVRGYSTETRDFAVCIKDRWGNISDTLVKSCTPIYEELLDKKTWRKYQLPGDHTDAHPGYQQWKFENMWDGKLTGNDMYHTGNSIEWPTFFTIDLGSKKKFSRFKLWQRQDNTAYSGNNVRLFEVYGSNTPNNDGSWESWERLDLFEVIKPSGAPVGTNTAEDMAVHKAGIDFDIAPKTPPYRYLRFKILETWGRVNSLVIAELSFWGRNEK